jgi:beta-N-acetylhexosaminidase
MGDLSEGARLKRWFGSNGWELGGSGQVKGVYTLTIRNLGAWEAPEGLLPSIQRVSFSFDLIHGPENAATVLEHVKTHSTPEILALYNLALADNKACGIVRAKSPVDGSLVGTVIICRPDSGLATYIPVLKPRGTELVGGVIAPVVPASQQQAGTVLQGLSLLGIRQNKAHRAGICVLSWVDGTERDVLLEMGFDVLDAFEVLSCSTERVSL